MEDIITKNGLCDFEFVNKLKKIFSEYNYNDLCKAVFCINSWRYNRAHLSLYISLNYLLCVCDRNGSKRINEYTQFTRFCRDIFGYYKVSLVDDIIPDFGEIKIPFNKHFYPVIIGTGYDFAFPFLQCCDKIAKLANQYAEMEEVLKYVEKIVDALGNVELYDEKVNYIDKAIVPSEKYFEVSSAFYSTINIESQPILKDLSFEKTNNIEITHFITFDKKEYYPLFNPSIVIDACRFIIKKYINNDDKRSQVADLLLYYVLHNNFDGWKDKECVLFNAGIIEDFENKKILDQKLFNYILLDLDCFIIFINKKRLNEYDVDLLRNKIQKIIDDNNLKIIQVLEKQNKIYNLPNYHSFEIIIYDENISLDNTAISFITGETPCIYFYDLISILYQAQKPIEIVKFFNLYNNNKLELGISYGGFSVTFQAWLDNNQELSQGAIEFKRIITEVYYVEWHFYKKYIDLSKWYPFNDCSFIFRNPQNWLIEGEENSFISISNKAIIGFGGYYRKVNNSYIFLSYNAVFENKKDKPNERLSVFNTLNDLLERNFVQFEELLINNGFYDFNGVQLIFFPLNYTKTINTGLLNKKRKYVYSEMVVQEKIAVIRFTVEEKELFNAIGSATDKSVECDFFKELLQCFEKTELIDFNKIAKGIDEKRKEKKEIDLYSVEIKYYFSEANIGLRIDDQSYIKVRKKIAYDCKNVNLLPGVYENINATGIVRKLQNLTINHFENEIKKYDKIVLHKQLLSILAFYTHSQYVELKRYNLIHSERLSDEAKNVTAHNTINVREKSKNNIREIYYFIDTNLSIEHTNNIIPEESDVRYFLAFSHWLILLQDCADYAYYDLFGAKIEIFDDYRVSTVFDDEKESEERNRRIYNNEEYSPHLENGIILLQQAVDGFYCDTGVKFTALIDICFYLSREFTSTFQDKEIIPDVFEIPYKDIINDFASIITEKSQCSLKEYVDALNYMIVEFEKIKTIGGEKSEIVPIWERENRSVRFEVRPVVRNNDNIIFSPVVINNFIERWKWGTISFYPPYEYGLSNYKKALTNWKNQCENAMENEIADLFKGKLQCIVLKGVELHKFDKEYGHPIDLGDYDVLVIDKTSKIVWNLESKFLGKVGSIREYYNHQDSFFNKDKKDEKFSRRIAYLHKHLPGILKRLEIENANDYNINDFMVTNKVFVPDLKKVDFEIITINELKKMI